MKYRAVITVEVEEETMGMAYESVRDAMRTVPAWSNPEVIGVARMDFDPLRT